MKAPLTGPFAAHLQKYIELRGALGHSVTASENHAKSFDRFSLRIGLIRPELSEELAMS